MADTSRAVDLSVTRLAVQTPMQRAHTNGVRRATAFLKNRLTRPEEAEETLAQALRLYLREWSKVYDEGSKASQDITARTVLLIRHDTLLQMAAELEKIDPASSAANPE